MARNAEDELKTHISNLELMWMNVTIFVSHVCENSRFQRWWTMRWAATLYRYTHLVGSSKNMTGGLSTNSNAIAKRFRCPPDKLPVLILRVSYKPIASKICWICCGEGKTIYLWWWCWPFRHMDAMRFFSSNSFQTTHPNFFFWMWQVIADFQIGRKMHCFPNGDVRLQYIILHDVSCLSSEQFQISRSTVYCYVTAFQIRAKWREREKMRKKEKEWKKVTSNASSFMKKETISFVSVAFQVAVLNYLHVCTE